MTVHGRTSHSSASYSIISSELALSKTIYYWATRPMGEAPYSLAFSGKNVPGEDNLCNSFLQENYTGMSPFLVLSDEPDRNEGSYPHLRWAALTGDCVSTVM